MSPVRTERVIKVVYDGFEYTDYEEDERFSAVIRNEMYLIKYKVGEWAEPKIGYIYAFDTVEHAIEFASEQESNMKFLEIWWAEAEIADEPDIPRISTYLAPTDIMRFWRKYRGGEFDYENWPRAAPTGTIWCHRLKLLEEVDLLGYAA